MPKKVVIECVFNKQHTIVRKNGRYYCLDCEAFSAAEREVDV